MAVSKTCGSIGNLALQSASGYKSANLENDGLLAKRELSRKGRYNHLRSVDMVNSKRRSPSRRGDMRIVRPDYPRSSSLAGARSLSISGNTGLHHVGNGSRVSFPKSGLSYPKAKANGFAIRNLAAKRDLGFQSGVKFSQPARFNRIDSVSSSSVGGSTWGLKGVSVLPQLGFSELSLRIFVCVFFFVLMFIAFGLGISVVNAVESVSAGGASMSGVESGPLFLT